MNEIQKRRRIKTYFERLHRYNERKDKIHYLAIFLAFFAGIFLVSGGILTSLTYFIFSSFCWCYLYFPSLGIDEKRIDKWLEEDKDKLYNKAYEKLELFRELYTDNISLWAGVNKEISKEYIGEELYIDSDEFFIEKGLDGKRRYGVYTFGEIFLCKSFLAYYKCYWNFIRGASINDEFSEYLYITITSVKYEEVSATKEITKPGVSKRIRYNSFTINTSDSKTTSFLFSLGAEVKFNSEPYVSDIEEPSEAQKAVKRIRDEIRKRRVDYQPVRLIDSEFGKY